MTTGTNSAMSSKKPFNAVKQKVASGTARYSLQLSDTRCVTGNVQGTCTRTCKSTIEGGLMSGVMPNTGCAQWLTVAAPFPPHE